MGAKNYLKNYNYYKQAIINIQANIALIDCELESTPIKTSKWGIEPIGGSGLLTTTEQSVQRRLQLEQQKEYLTKEIQNLQNIIDQIDVSIDKLPIDECQVVRMYYMQGLTHVNIAIKLHYSERTIRYRLGRAIQALDIMINHKKELPA